MRADAPTGEGQRWVQLAPPGGQTSITLVTWFEGMPAGSMDGLVLETADIDGTYKELAGRGVTFGGPIVAQPWGRFAEFSDPDGNGLLLVQSTAQ